jgi:hypothetical protein
VRPGAGLISKIVRRFGHAAEFPPMALGAMTISAAYAPARPLPAWTEPHLQDSCRVLGELILIDPQRSLRCVDSAYCFRPG